MVLILGVLGRSASMRGSRWTVFLFALCAMGAGAPLCRGADAQAAVARHFEQVRAEWQRRLAAEKTAMDKRGALMDEFCGKLIKPRPEPDEKWKKTIDNLNVIMPWYQGDPGKVLENSEAIKAYREAAKLFTPIVLNPPGGAPVVLDTTLARFGQCLDGVQFTIPAGAPADLLVSVEVKNARLVCDTVFPHKGAAVFTDKQYVSEREIGERTWRFVSRFFAKGLKPGESYSLGLLFYDTKEQPVQIVLAMVPPESMKDAVQVLGIKPLGETPLGKIAPAARPKAPAGLAAVPPARPVEPSGVPAAFPESSKMKTTMFYGTVAAFQADPAPAAKSAKVTVNVGWVSVAPGSVSPGSRAVLGMSDAEKMLGGDSKAVIGRPFMFYFYESENGGKKQPVFLGAIPVDSRHFSAWRAATADKERRAKGETEFFDKTTAGWEEDPLKLTGLTCQGGKWYANTQKYDVMRVTLEGNGLKYSPIPGKFSMQDLDWADFKGDGSLWVVGCDFRNGKVALSRTWPDGGLITGHPWHNFAPTMENRMCTLGIGDMEGDGKKEIVALWSNGVKGQKNMAGIQVLRYSPQILQSSPVSGELDAVAIVDGLRVPWSEKPDAAMNRPRMGDVNGDGNADVVVTDNGHGITNILSFQNGKYLLVRRYNVPEGRDCEANLFDLFGDGRCEVVTGTNGGNVFIERMDRNFNEATLWSENLGRMTFKTYAADFDGDGIMEIVVLHSSTKEYNDGRITVLKSENGIDWSVVWKLDLDNESLSRPYNTPIIADLDQDGVPSLILAHRRGGGRVFTRHPLNGAMTLKSIE
jgi:hypothetical protein